MKKLLVVGLPFFTKKYSYMTDAYRSINIHPKILLNINKIEFNDYSDIEYAGKNKILRMYSYLKSIYKYKPDFIDCYDYSLLSLYYVLVARALGIEVRFWLIGRELEADMTHFNKRSLALILLTHVKRYLTIQSLRLSSQIFAKELHHLSSIKKIKPNLLNKTISIFNAVPVEEAYVSRGNLSKDFIYANAVIESRNVDALMRSFNQLKNNDFKFTAAVFGFNSISNEVYASRGAMYSDKVLKLYDNLDIKDLVNVYGFIEGINRKMQDYKFFVLPGDGILANYALLEAMAMGLVPIIYPGEGYEAIVTDGVNGIVAVDYDLTSAFEKALKLSDEDYTSMSRQAYLKIKSEFSLDEWSSKLALYT